MSCDPTDISIDVPSGPSGPQIPGFGEAFSLNLPNLNPFGLLKGQPEDLLDLLDRLQLLLPSGALKPQLSLNFGKDVFDSILKLMDQFFPFLMLYKFFLPILNIIICIIEVLCAIPNPFKIIKSITRLFTVCIPNFLALFPIFAFIIMIISLLLLLLALIEYIIAKILEFINLLLRNIQALNNAFQEGNANSVLAIAKKIGSLLCIFQNLFVLLSIFTTVIQIIKDILGQTFNIPPCDDNNGSTSGCCTPDVCPNIIKSSYTRITGNLKYLNRVNQLAESLPNNFGVIVRGESWQLYDTQQDTAQAFINIVDGYDVPQDPNDSPPFFKPIFFPTDSVYNAQTAVRQAPYTIDLFFLYNPANFGRVGIPRNIQFKDCILTAPPSNSLQEGDLSVQFVRNGVNVLAGGKGFEEDGYTILTGFDTNGITPINVQATLENFIHVININSITPILNINDGILFNNVQYTFKPNVSVLLGKDLITAGCVPDISMAKAFINNAFAGDVGLKTVLLQDLLNNKSNAVPATATSSDVPNTNIFPDTNTAQQCLATAISALRTNITTDGVAQFQATTTLCLQKLKDDTNSAIQSMIGLGFDPCKSLFTASPQVQFTSKPIIVSVNLNENNGLPLTTGISSDIANNLATRLSAHITFGNISKFLYDGNSSFTAELTSNTAGSGEVMISFDNNILCNNSTDPIGHTLQNIEYQFIYTPFGTTIVDSTSVSISVPQTAEGDQSDGNKPMRNDDGT